MLGLTVASRPSWAIYAQKGRAFDDTTACASIAWSEASLWFE